MKQIKKKSTFIILFDKQKTITKRKYIIIRSVRGVKFNFKEQKKKKKLKIKRS